MTWSQSNLEWGLFSFGIICGMGGYYIGHNIGKDVGFDSGFHAGKDLADRAHMRQGKSIKVIEVGHDATR